MILKNRSIPTIAPKTDTPLTISPAELRRRIERGRTKGHDPREACYMVPDARGVPQSVWATSATEAEAKMALAG